MTTYLGKSCSFGLPRVPFVNCRRFMYLVISLLVYRAGCGIWLYQFLIIAYLLLCLKDLKCNNVKNYCLLVNKRSFLSTKLKKNICKTFYRLKMWNIPKEISEIPILLQCTKCISHVGNWYITMHFIFVQPPYLHKMVCFFNSWKRIVKTIVR